MLTACNQSSTSSGTTPAEQNNSDSAPAQTQKAEKEQKLHLNTFTEPSSLHPGLATDIWSSNVLLQTFEGLTRINQKGEPQEAMAKDIKVSEDLLTYTFTLQDHAKWSNGDPVTAHDFEYAWKWVLTPANASEYAYQLFYIKNAEKAFKGEGSVEDVGVNALDDRTLEVKLENPTPFFRELTAFTTYFPINSKIAKDNPKWAENAGELYTSNGPFKMTAWEHKNKIMLEKNEHYWDAQHVKLESIEMLMINEANTELSLFESGELDWAGAPAGNIPLDAMESLKDKGTLEIVPKAGTYWYEFNTGQKPFSNAKIRKAFAYAINRQELVDNVTQGGEIPAMAVVPTSMFPENEKGFFKDHDVETAKQLLAEGLKEEGYAGVEALPAITLSYNTDEAQAQIAQAVQDMWRKNLGVEVKLENQEWTVYYDNIKNGNYQVARMGWTGDFNDPINFLEIFRDKGGNNHTGWSDPRYTDLLVKSSTEGDAEKRKAILREAEQILMEGMPVIPFYFKTTVYAKKPNLKDVVISGLGNAQYKWAYFE